MDRKILLFSRDPGGANVVIPLVEPLARKGYRVSLFGADTALKKYSNAGLEGRDIKGLIASVDPAGVAGFLSRERPDFVITGTSADDFTEKYIWKAAEELKIPSFAILDHWLNYGIRFSKYAVSEIRKYDKDRRHDYLPSKILVMDEWAAREACADGLERSRILVTGQPYFETLLDKAKKVTGNGIGKIRERFGIGDEFTITFAPEPISRLYKETDDSDHYLGYTERTILRELLSAVKDISAAHDKKISLIVKLHPRDDPGNYSDIFKGEGSGKVNIVIERDAEAHELISISDLVCGMSSMFLIEAAILNKPVISIMIGLKRENPFILDRAGVIKSVLDKDELMARIMETAVEKRSPGYSLDIVKNPVENVIRHMEAHLCRN